MAVLVLLSPFDVFYLHLEYLFCGNLVYIFPKWYVRRRKIWQPCSGATFSCSSTHTTFNVSFLFTASTGEKFQSDPKLLLEEAAPG
jgi:hypothetical protein